MNFEAEIGAKRKKYSNQFKLETIRLYENGDKSMAQVERELGNTDGLFAKRREDLGSQEGACSTASGGFSLRIVLLASTTSTKRPARAKGLTSANPLGPAPTTRASNL
jgi:transposase-like protein